MNRKAFLFALVCGLSFGGWADASAVTDLVYRQRWPWSSKVDIHFNYVGEGGDVVLFATWDGQTAPVELVPPALTGRSASVSSGSHHLEWNPAEAGFAESELRNFRLEVSVVPASERKYLVVDLTTGTYSYLSDAPNPAATDGGWSDEYRLTKMAFRRVPAGTYAIGDSSSTFSTLGAWEYKSYVPRRVTLTSDFYIGIYPMTMKQRYNITKSGSDWSNYAQAPDGTADAQYLAMRGRPSDDPSVCWPTTGYRVSPNSVLGKLRALTSNRFVFDLPEEEQWEVAARSGTTTLFPQGGDPADKSGMTNIVNRIAYVSANPRAGEARAGVFGRVGFFEPNGWGIYDMVGNCMEWTLDVAIDAVRGDSTDPVGPPAKGDGTDARRARSAKFDVKEIWKFLPSIRSTPSLSDTWSTGSRIAIHLNPLDFAAN